MDYLKVFKLCFLESTTHLCLRCTISARPEATILDTQTQYAPSIGELIMLSHLAGAFKILLQLRLEHHAVLVQKNWVIAFYPEDSFATLPERGSYFVIRKCRV